MRTAEFCSAVARTGKPPDWRAYFASWDRQQEEFNPDRERRFGVMFEVLGAQVGTRFTALDLGCGPGSLTQRMLRRFPAARSVAVDFDPVVLRIGGGALGSLGGRVTWVDAKLGSRGWTKALPAGRFDAALSTTALHWLEPRDLGALYRDLHRILRKGGVFLNGDIMPWDGRRPGPRRIAQRVYRNRFGTKNGRPRNAGWERWWARAERDPALRPSFEERRARQSCHPHHAPPSLGTHVAALRRAGFREIEVVWEDFENRVLMALR